ncbi:MAG: ATP-binding protein [Bacteroidales bacterium]|nr:ATP-binding protein [Bacteroidales bacterium]
MIIKRDYYLQQLISSKSNNLIKIVTGIRRCGKSFLLFNLFHNHLIENGINEDHIIEIALDDRLNKNLRDPDAILQHIHKHIVDEQLHYIILDEVQMIDEFTDVLNSLLHIRNADVYVTGSNSKFLSKDVATEFRGRGDEIHLFPLSFAELYNSVGGDKSELWKSYYTYGGLPGMLELDKEQKKASYLQSLHETVYLKDIIERNNLKNSEEFMELMRVMASCIGAPCNPNKLENTFKSVKKVSLDRKTISKYLTCMEEAFLIEKSMRYDIKGRKYIGSLSKYYFQDIGLRNALLNFRQMEDNHIMENVIYNELRSRGFCVDVGMIETRTTTERKQLEVDFIANMADQRYYIQSAFAMPDDAKREQECASLKRIDDSFKKIIIVRDDIKPYHDDNGFYIVGLMDFLLKPNLMDE